MGDSCAATGAGTLHLHPGFRGPRSPRGSARPRAGSRRARAMSDPAPAMARLRLPGAGVPARSRVPPHGPTHVPLRRHAGRRLTAGGVPVCAASRGDDGDRGGDPCAPGDGRAWRDRPGAARPQTEGPPVPRRTARRDRQSHAPGRSRGGAIARAGRGQAGRDCDGSSQSRASAVPNGGAGETPLA